MFRRPGCECGGRVADLTSLDGDQRPFGTKMHGIPLAASRKTAPAPRPRAGLASPAGGARSSGLARPASHGPISSSTCVRRDNDKRRLQVLRTSSHSEGHARTAVHRDRQQQQCDSGRPVAGAEEGGGAEGPVVLRHGQGGDPRAQGALGLVAAGDQEVHREGVQGGLLAAPAALVGSLSAHAISASTPPSAGSIFSQFAACKTLGPRRSCQAKE